MPTVLVPLAQGCEELEAITIIDLLRRAGITVISVGLDEKPVKASRGVVLIPDTTMDLALRRSYDMIVLPGGLPGSDNLNKDLRIHALLKEVYNQGKYVAAICAAPKVLASVGLLDNKSVTSYPGLFNSVIVPKFQLVDEPVVKDGRVITSRGPGTAIAFALTLIETLTDKDTRNRVEAELVG